jgi:two-component system, cell cycle sensor histidine kinase and response regulator CckA
MLNEVEQHLRLLSTALEAAANAIVITDHQGIISWVNPAFTTLSGYTAQEVIGQNPRLLKSGIQGEKYYAELWETISCGKVWKNEIVNRRKDGSLYTEDMTITPVLSEAGQITHFIAIKQDISGRKHVEAQLNEQVEELQRWFDITTGRESRILMLKKEVNELLEKSGEPPRYPSAIVDP